MGAKEDAISPVTRVPLSQMEAGSSRDTGTTKLRKPNAQQIFMGPNNRLAGTFIEDWKSFLNKKAMSDLTIYVEKDLEVPAHKLVLYVRCKAILKDVVSEVSLKTKKKISDMVLWVDVSYKAALAFLQFLYCGLTNKILLLNEEDLLSVKRLSARYNVTELSHYLRAVNIGIGRVHGNKASSSNLSPCHSASYCKRQTAFHTSCLSDQSVCSQAANTPRKEICSKNTLHFLNLTAELTMENTSSETKNGFCESVESRLCSSGSLSPDLFMEDTGEPGEETVSQGSRNNMEYLLNMLGKPSLSQSNSQNSSLLTPSEKLSQNITDISCAMMSSEKLAQSDAQTSSAQMSLDKLSPTKSCSGKCQALQKNVACINGAVHILDNNTQITSPSQLCDDKHVTCDKGMMSVGDTENKCDLLPFTYTAEDVANTSPKEIKGQTDLLGGNSEEPQESTESDVYSECDPLQDSGKKAGQVDSGFDSIDFMEHLLSDSNTGANSVRVHRETKERIETKRKHPEIDSISNHCKSSVKRVCRGSTEGEVVKTCSNNTENKEEPDVLKFENNVIATLDLTQSSSDSESTQPQSLILSSPVRKSTVNTNIEAEKSSTHPVKDCAEFTLSSDVFHKSEEIVAAGKESNSRHFDNSRKTTAENNAGTVKQKGESAEGDRCMKYDDNVQDNDNWDKFDEMCQASVPHIFSQCLSQLISSQTTSQKPRKLRTSSDKRRVLRRSGRSLSLSPTHPQSEIQGSVTNYSPTCSSSPVRKGKNISENVRNAQSLSHDKGSQNVNDVLQNSLLAQLNESVFWRDENAPTLPVSPKRTVPSNPSNTVDHRTPVHNQTDVIFSDKVTPPANYTAMKTPQLKVITFQHS
jgi:hypothetical protein